jgi:hypothetical protein
VAPVSWADSASRTECGRAGVIRAILTVVEVYVCDGCGNRKRERKLISKALPRKAEIVGVGCQKICDGPATGLPVNGKLEWFRKVDSKRALAGLKQAIKKGKLNKALTRRRVKKRSGKLR